MEKISKAKPNRNTDRMMTRLFLRLLPLQILLAVLNSVNTLINGMFASNAISSEAMGAIGLFSPVNLIFTSMGMVLLGGSQVLCGRFMGKSQHDRMKSVFTLVILMVLAFGLIMGLILLIFPSQLATLLGASGETHRLLTGYIVGFSCVVIPQIMGSQLTSFLSIERREKRSFVAVIGLVLSNIVFDFLFLNLFKLETFGLALATALSYVVFCVILGSRFVMKSSLFKFSIKNIEWHDLPDIFRTGYIAALSNAYQAVRGFVINYALLTFSGSAAVAGYSISNTIDGFLWSAPLGIIAVYRLLCSIAAGEEDPHSIVHISRLAMVKINLAVLIGTGVCAVFAGVLVLIFCQDTESEIYYMAVISLRFNVTTFFTSLLVNLFTAYGQIMGRPLLIHILTFMDGVFDISFFALILSPAFKDLGVWMALTINGILTTFAIVIIAWVKNKHFPRSIRDVLCMPEDFGVQDKDRLGITITDKGQVTSVSEGVYNFCIERDIDKKRAYYASLAIEEMTGNIVKYGFKPKNNKNMVDIRVVCKDGDLVISIKDDCRKFDPLQFQYNKDGSDNFKNIGIHLIRKLSKDMTYRSTLGLNVLTIVV